MDDTSLESMPYKPQGFSKVLERLQIAGMMEVHRLAVLSKDDAQELIKMVKTDNESAEDCIWLVDWLMGVQAQAQTHMRLHAPMVHKNWASDVYVFTRNRELDKKRDLMALAQRVFTG